MRLLAVINEPANVARYFAGVGETTEVPRRSPGYGPPHWKSQVLRLQESPTAAVAPENSHES